MDLAVVPICSEVLGAVAYGLAVADECTTPYLWWSSTSVGVGKDDGNLLLGCVPWRFMTCSRVSQAHSLQRIYFSVPLVTFHAVLGPEILHTHRQRGKGIVQRALGVSSIAQGSRYSIPGLFLADRFSLACYGAKDMVRQGMLAFIA